MDDPLNIPEMMEKYQAVGKALEALAGEHDIDFHQMALIVSHITYCTLAHVNEADLTSRIGIQMLELSGLQRLTIMQEPAGHA